MEAISYEKAMSGVRNFLKSRDYTILEENWAHGTDKADFIAKDEDTLVFIHCDYRTNDGNGFASERFDRRAAERVAAAYLAANPDLEEGPVRFDKVSLLVLNDHRALLRHHINAASVGTDLCPA